MPDAAATVTVKIPFLPWTARADLEIQVPLDTSGATSLVDASLDGAILVDASLDGAILVDASLDGASLDRASLDGIRNDFWDVLLRAQPEVPGLLSALREGRIDGFAYSGECACLAGTIAKLRNVHFGDLGFADAARPIERWFLGIGRGDRPKTNRVSAITEGWILEFQALIGVAP